MAVGRRTALAVMCMAAAGCSTETTCIDEYEPNEDNKTAPTVGAVVQAVYDDNADWFSPEIPAYSQGQVTLQFDPALGSLELSNYVGQVPVGIETFGPGSTRFFLWNDNDTAAEVAVGVSGTGLCVPYSLHFDIVPIPP